MIAPMRAQFDDILAHPSDAPSLDFRLPKHKSQELWSWCDALFMSPPAWLRLAKATGDQRYRDFAVTEVVAHVGLSLRHQRASVFPRQHLFQQARGERPKDLLESRQRLGDGRAGALAAISAAG